MDVEAAPEYSPGSIMSIRISLRRRHALLSAAGAILAVSSSETLAVPTPDNSESPLSAARIREQILRLEKSADMRGLPVYSAGSSRNAASIRSEQLYLSTVPRLIELIERDNSSPSTIGQEAGGLLSEINSLQHQIPDVYLHGTRAPVPAFASLTSEYSKDFENFMVRSEYKAMVSWYIKTLMRFQKRYEKVQEATSVPWFVIGIIHALEGSFNFLGHLHNGDYPLSSRTKNVPPNRPEIWLPPSDWESSAKDALEQMNFSGKKDWTLEKILYRFEAYNGFGYRRRRIHSPYLWSFSDKYTSGKFVTDGKYDKSKKSEQCGAAIMLKSLFRGGEIKLEFESPLKIKESS